MSQGFGAGFVIYQGDENAENAGRNRMKTMAAVRAPLGDRTFATNNTNISQVNPAKPV